MTLTRHDIHSWNPSALNDVGEAWLAVGRKVEEQFENYVNAVTTVNNHDWQGITADAAQAQATADRKTAYAIVDKLDAVAQKAKLGAESIGRYLGDARDTLAIAVENKFVVADDLTVSDSKSDPTDERIKLMHELQNTLRDKAKLAEDADAQLNQDLQTATNDLRATFTSAETLGADQGAEDGHDLATNPATLTPEQVQRIVEAGTLTPTQLASMAGDGPVTIPASQMEYINQVARSLDGKSPREIQAIATQLPPNARTALANAMQIISNERVTTSVKGDPKGPTNGGADLLPQKIRESLTRRDLVVRTYGSMSPGDVRPQIDLNGVKDNQAIALLVAAGDDQYKAGSALDHGLLEVGRQYLDAQASHDDKPYEYIFFDGHPAISGEDRSGEALYTAITEDIFSSVAPDKAAVEQALANTEHGGDFVHDLLTRNWSNERPAMALFEFAENDSTVEDSNNRADVLAATRSGNIMQAVAQYMSTDEGAAALLNIEGENSESVGQRNPELLNSISHGLAPYIPDLAGVDQPTRPGFDTAEWLNPNTGHNDYAGSRNVFTVLNSGSNAGGYFTQATIAEIIRDEGEYAANPRDPQAGQYLSAAGRLDGLMDTGMQAALQDEYNDKNAHEKEVYERQSKAFDIASTLLGAAAEKSPHGEAAGLLLDMAGDSVKEGIIGKEPGDAEHADLNGPDLNSHYYSILNAAADHLPSTFPDTFPDAFDAAGRLRSLEEIQFDLRERPNDLGQFQTMVRLLGNPADLGKFEDSYNQVTHFGGAGK
ncbi:hypothetical protein [Antrihabitans stalactiti]|uniref:TPR repeat domain-containing protein n=1 Tax=Antrihabitans stalactiti TaxID=2584121 RepID=A0A848KST3_9NOCA|nr:hypothetical protein [Antrihabitans stalactiti]NMN98617.1 hypothetical protein [Antrihabitans stalactiti]